ncbi:MAG: 5-methyltetrahydrofolate--homocysteine methyltransferase [Bacteroidaceae bacterium]|nr:5-methyltetrahydrofolate--homocysteine methyltransferase [Bacteroidaceae bacterium]
MTLVYRPSELAAYISWPYFFHAWQLQARFAAVASVHACTACRAAWVESFPAADRDQAREALRLFEDAEACLHELEREGGEVRARFLILPCRSDGDDLLFEDTWRLPCLRQQRADAGKPSLCLADFVLPRGREGGDGVSDRVGLFATCVERAMEREESGDPYRTMLRQTVCDRLAEAAAERMHEEVRKRHWGYAPDEALTQEELHREAFQGIRPAVGYPCLPDQRAIFPIARRLGFDELGIALTESGAMLPHAATCGLMLAHPAARYFAVGEVSPDQRADYERRMRDALAQDF